MKLIELLSDDIFDIPIARNDIYTQNILKTKFEQYVTLLKKIENTDDYTDSIIEQIDNISKLCKKILATIKSYLQGSPYLAYKNFSEGISELTVFLHFRIRERIKYPQNIDFYRLRSSNDKYLTKKDIFHIPFELRGKVQNQRYSINGLPCLYFGSSIYVCWEELNRPNFENMYVSKFKLKKSAKILDLTFSRKTIQNTILNKGSDADYHNWCLFNIVEKIILFPLILSCSIINKENTDIFKEEYIIPQILLEWISNEKNIDAIQYLSLSLPDYNLSDHLYTNYVFPVKNLKENGYCDYLINRFDFTDPISWNFAKSIDGHTRTTSLSIKRDFNIMNKKRSYQYTEFGHMEELISLLEFNHMGNT